VGSNGRLNIEDTVRGRGLLCLQQRDGDVVDRDSGSGFTVQTAMMRMSV
jgi:hypothetical protein